MSNIQISAADVNKLRQKTGAGMMDCKKALTEAKGDFEKAIDLLRKKGAKVSEKRSDREANEGVVIAKVSSDEKIGVIVELNCETDFVAKNEGFIELAENIASTALEKTPNSIEDLMEMSVEGKKISDAIIDNIGKIGEKITLSGVKFLKAEKVVPYIHNNYRIGVLAGLNKSGDSFNEIGLDIAMQIAAMNPVSVDKKDVDQATVDRELSVAREQIKSEGKPEAMIEKIAQGKLNKFYKEFTLLNQESIKDNSKSVSQTLSEIEKDLTVTGFVRVVLGS